MKFWKQVFATIVGIIIMCFLCSVLSIMVISSLSFFSSKTATVKPNSVLYMNFDVAINDNAPSEFIPSFNFAGQAIQQPLGLNSILKCIEKAKTDDNIKGIFINTMSFSGGLSKAHEVREALENFKKESGKFIVAYSKSMELSGYYVSSAADKIFMNTEGSLKFYGLSGTIMFYKNMLDKLDVDVQVFRPEGCKFKSAVEPFILDKMSEASKEQTKKYMSSMWNNILRDISTSRNISIDDLNYYADNLLITGSKAAEKYGLIDEASHYDLAEQYVNVLLGNDSTRKPETITISKYAETIANDKEVDTRDRIAVIYATGNIIDGKGNESKIGDVTLSKQIQEARKDKNVKAVVLRVDSPGGSALASEVILREIILTKAEKPVIASFGRYAASGGYYISCMSDKIVCEENSITGSIGVFGMLPDASKLLQEKIGITIDHVNTNKNSSLTPPFEAMSDGWKDYFNTNVNDVYTTFISHVAEGRNMTVEAVDAIAQGRVWLGSDAINIGLVDELGGLSRAIEVAAETANIEKYQITTFPKPKDPYTQIMEMFSGDDYEANMAAKLGVLYQYYETLTYLNETSGVQARLPYYIDIK